MRNAQRVFFNTIALYVKIIINVFVSLFLTRIVLNALGVNDYGIYNLIAGTIAFLSFLNSALSSSAQRYFSVLKGKKDPDKLKQYFSTSLIIHLLLSILLIIVFEIAYLFLFDGFFNIAADKVYSAKIVYQLTCLSMIATVCGVPFTSAINANEDLVFYAIIESVCSALKLMIILLFKIPGVNLLIVYTAWLALITILGLFIYWKWCTIKYTECQNLVFKIDKNVLSKMLSFSGWNSLGAFAMMCRSQGVAFVINIFWGTAINAVYGIANQVNGQLSYFSQMLSASFAPQIMKSVGEENFNKLRFLSLFCSKIAFYMSAIFAIPLIINMDFILKIWLKNVPPLTNEFCILIIFVFLIMQLYPGIVRAILAIGNIKNYQITISIFLVLPVFIGAYLYHIGLESYSICYVMIIAQILTLVATSVFAHIYYNLSLPIYYRFVMKSIISFSLIILIFTNFHSVFLEEQRTLCELILSSILSMALFSMYYFYGIISCEERKKILSLIKKQKT